MSQKYVLWTSKIEPNACTLSELTGFKKLFALKQGISQGETFPTDVTMQMDARKPTDTLLTDNVRNLKNIIVVSSALKKFLLDHSVGHLEFLPITVLDHKARPVGEEHFIMNPIDNPECLDLAACEPVWSDIDDTVIASVQKLVISAEWDGGDRLMFRPKFYRARPLVSADLAEKITAAGFTGIRWEPISEVTGHLS